MENRCVCCGEIIPEGRQVCPNCENHIANVRKMVALKPCEYCGKLPEMQRGVEFMSMMEKFRHHCPRCNTTSKSAYTIEGAIEEWNRSVEDGQSV